jgi:hypothetical protein
VAQIDAPLLTNFQITFPYEFFFDPPQLPQFIDRAEDLSPDCISQSQHGSIMQICKHSLLTLSTVKTLGIWDDGFGVAVLDDFDLVEFCRPFTAVECVGVSREVGLLAGPALEALTWGKYKHMLPALIDVWME